MAPLLDVFITMLSMGAEGYRSLIQERKRVYTYFRSQLQTLCAARADLVLLNTPSNPISMSLGLKCPRTLHSDTNSPSMLVPSSSSLASSSAAAATTTAASFACPRSLPAAAAEGEAGPSSGYGSSPWRSEDVTMLGSMLFTRTCSGARAVSGEDKKKIGDMHIEGWGAHHDHFPFPYITVAAAIGMTIEDVDVFMKRLKKVLSELGKKVQKRDKKEQGTEEKGSGDGRPKAT